MKVHRKRIRLIKGLALAGCSVGLAVPAIAGASPAGGPGPISGARTAPVVVLHPHGRPVLPQANYTLPSSFKTDAQAQSQSRLSEPTQLAGAGSRTYVLPASHQTDAQTSPPAQTTPPASTVVHEVRTVQSDDHTLAIVLAAAALGIALCGTGYALTRVSTLQRRVAGTSS
jgi:hypothetical protein